MTVLSTYTPPQYTGNGATKVFAFSFPFFALSDLAINLFDTTANANVVPQPVLGGSGTYDYTIAGTPDPNTGEYPSAIITFNNAPLGNHRITITRAVPATQGNHYQNNGPFPAPSVESMGDRAAMVEQQLAAELARTLTVPVSDPAGLTLTLPAAGTRANQFLGFDGGGDVIAALPSAGAPISSFMQPVVAATSADGARGLLTAARANCVIMARNADTANDGSGAAWVVYKPDGSLLNITGTTTMGLQEAINYAAEFGFDLLVYGGPTKPGNWPPPFDPVGHPGDNPAIITCTTPISVPSVEQGCWRLQSVTVLSKVTAAQQGWIWDSALAFDFAWLGGQLIVNSGNIGMLWLPTNKLPLDNAAGVTVTTSRFRIPSIVMQTGGATCAQLDDTNGTIGGNFFEFIEPNGGANGVALVGASKGVTNNHIRITECHAQTSFGVMVGTSATAGNLVYGNLIEADVEVPAGGLGVDIYGSNNVIHACVISGGAAAEGVKLESSAAQNQITATLSGAFTIEPIQDASTARSSVINAGNDAVSANQNGAGQTIATGTWTKLNLTNKPFDRMATFSGANSRWTPGIPGVGLISAAVNWSTALSVGTEFVVGIYKNGLNIAERSAVSGSASPNQAVEIAALVTIDAPSDYFEIWVFQNGAGNASVDGAVTNTWATFVRLR